MSKVKTKSCSGLALQESASSLPTAYAGNREWCKWSSNWHHKPPLLLTSRRLKIADSGFYDIGVNPTFVKQDSIMRK